MTDRRTEGSAGLDDAVWARKGLCFAEHKRFWCVMALGLGVHSIRGYWYSVRREIILGPGRCDHGRWADSVQG